MKYTEEQIEKILELKESIIDKMEKHQEELDFLQKNLDVLDVVLKGSSFTKASSLPRNEIPRDVNLDIQDYVKSENTSIKNCLSWSNSLTETCLL